MSVEHAIAYLVLIVCAAVALAYLGKQHGKRSSSPSRALAYSGADDLRTARPRGLGIGFILLALTSLVFLAGALYLAAIFDLQIWGYFLGYGWIWPWT